MTDNQRTDKVEDARKRYYEVTGKALAIDIPLSRLSKPIVIESAAELLDIIFIESRGKQR